MNTDGEFVFELIDDETGETVLTSPNIAPPAITFEDASSDGVARLRIRVKHGKDVTDQVIDIPNGQDGANIFICGKSLTPEMNKIYNGLPKHTLTSNSPSEFVSTNADNASPYLPEPRNNDVVIAADASGFYLGIIVNTASEHVDVLFKTYCKFPVPTIGENGNWYIYGDDTGHKSRPDFSIGKVEEADAPTASLVPTDDGYALNLGLVRGQRGKAIQIKSGVYTPDTLPSYAVAEDGDAYIVDDGDGRFDLYVAGEKPSPTNKGWTVVEDWQGSQGNSVCYADAVSTSNGATGTIVKAALKGDKPKVNDLVLDRNLQLWMITGIDSYNVSVIVLGTSISEIFNEVKSKLSGTVAFTISNDAAPVGMSTLGYSELVRAVNIGSPAVATVCNLYGKTIPTTAPILDADGNISFDAYHFQNLNTKIRHLDIYTIKIDANLAFDYSKREYTVVYPASKDNLGSVMVGDGLSIDSNGKLSVSSAKVQSMIDNRLASVLSTAKLNDGRKITFEV